MVVLLAYRVSGAIPLCFFTFASNSNTRGRGDAVVCAGLRETEGNSNLRLRAHPETIISLALGIPMVRQVTKGRGRQGKPANFRPAVIHATLERRDPNSSLCFQFGQYEDVCCHPSSQSREPKSIVRRIGVAALYLIVGGAVIRTLYFQYQINELSAKMVDATSLRQANLERLDKVRKEMGVLSDKMNDLKEKNTGLRKEQRDLDQERIHVQQSQKNEVTGVRGQLSSEEMGNI